MDEQSALVIAGHGSHLNPDSSRPVYDHADAIRETGAFGEVREAFWKEEPSLREVLRTVEGDPVYVVPLFMSEGYFTRRVLPRELRIADGHDLDVEKTVHYCDPVGTHEALTDVIVDRARTVTGATPDDEPGLSLSDVGLAVVGHGSDRHDDSGVSTRTHAERVRERDRFAEVDVLFLDEEPTVGSLPDRFESTDVVVVPLFVADGYHTKEDIPEELGIATDADPGYEVPATVGDHRIWYAGAVGTEPLVARLVLERAAEAGATVYPGSVEQVIGHDGGGEDRRPSDRSGVRR